jgi:TPR repeat protein
MTDRLMDDYDLLAREPDLERLRSAHALLSTNIAEGMVELEVLANAGSIMGMLYLAQAYELGQNADHVKAERWYRLAFERGSATALFSLGSIYYKRKDYVAAEKMFAEGASKNDAPSMYWLASIYLSTQSGPEKSEQARILLEDATKRGQVHAKHGLGLLYLKGRFGMKNIPRGLWLFLTGIIDAVRVTYRDPSSRRLW